jgi:hypothetical protein
MPIIMGLYRTLPLWRLWECGQGFPLKATVGMNSELIHQDDGLRRGN